MKLELVTLLGQKMNEDVYEVILPTASGDIAVYANHEPLVTVAVPGVITVRRNRSDSDAQREVFATSGGVAEISNNRLRVLVDEAEHADDITEAEARAAYEEAQKLRAEAKDQVDLDKAQQLIDRSAVRLKVADIRRRKRS